MADKNPFATEAAPTDNPFANPDYKHQGAVSRGFEMAIRQIPQTAGGALALLGDAVGSKGLREAGMGVYKGQEEKIQALSNPSDSFSNVLDGSGDVGEFLKHGAGYVGGQALTAVGTGGIGALVGRKLVEKGIAGEAAKLAASGLAEKGALEVAKQEALKTAAKRGAIAGAGAMNVMQEEGSIYPEALAQAEKDGRLTADGGLSGGDIARVGLSGLGAAALDTAMEGVMAGKLLKGGGGSTLARRAMKEVPAGMAREGVTEGLQTGVERFGAQQSLGDQEAIRDYIDSAALGALGGGLGGGAAAIAGGRGKTAMQTAVEAQTAPTADGSIPYEKVAIPQSGGLALQEPGAQSADAIPYQQTLAPYDGQLGVEGEQKPAGYQPRPEDMIGPGALAVSAKPQQEAPANALSGADVSPEIGQTSAPAAPLPAITPEAVTRATGINPAAGPLSAAAHVVVTQQMTKAQEALAGLSKLGRMAAPTQAPAGPITVNRMDDAQVRQMQKEGGFGAGFGTPGLVAPVVKRLGELPNRQGSFAEMSQKAESSTQKSANPFTTVAAPEYSKPSATTNEGKEMHVPRDVALGVKQERAAPVKRNVIKEAADKRLEDSFKKAPHELTPKQYHEQTIRDVMREYSLSRREALENYDTEPAREEHEQRWVRHVQEQFKSGAEVSAKTLDNLEKIRPGAFASFIHDSPDAKVPTGYQPPSARAVEAEKMAERSADKKAVREEYKARRTGGAEGLEPSSTAVKAGDLPRRIAGPAKSAAQTGANGLDLQPQPDSSTRPAPKAEPPAKRNVIKEAADKRTADTKAPWQMTREEFGVPPTPVTPDRPLSLKKLEEKAKAAPDSLTEDDRRLLAKQKQLRSAHTKYLRDHKNYLPKANAHFTAVRDAVRAGEAVPENVLSQYDSLRMERDRLRAEKVAKDSAQPQAAEPAPKAEPQAKRNVIKEAADKRKAKPRKEGGNGETLDGAAERARQSREDTTKQRQKADAVHAEVLAEGERLKKVADAAEQQRVEAADKRKALDHGELNVPGRTSSINRDLDKYKADGAAKAKTEAKSTAEQRRADKAEAKALFAQHGAAMIEKMGAKLGKKEVAHHLDQMVKWEPSKFNRLVAKFQKEQAEKETLKNGTEQSDNRGSGERAVPDAERGASTEGAAVANAEPANGRGTDLPGEPGAGTGQTGAVAGATDGGPAALTKGKPKTDTQMYAEIDAALKTAMPTDKARERTMVADLEARQRKDEADRQYAKDIKRNPTGAARDAVVNARDWEYTKADQVRGAAYAEQIGTVTFENGGSKWKVLNTVAKLMALRDTFAPNAGKGKPDRLGMERANPFGGKLNMETLQKRYPDLKIEEDKPDPTPPTGGKPTPATKDSAQLQPQAAEPAPDAVAGVDDAYPVSFVSSYKGTSTYKAYSRALRRDIRLDMTDGKPDTYRLELVYSDISPQERANAVASVFRHLREEAAKFVVLAKEKGYEITDEHYRKAGMEPPPPPDPTPPTGGKPTPATKETPKKGITPTWLKDLGISNGETLNFDIPEQFAQGALTVKKATKDEVVLTSARGSSTVLRKRVAALERDARAIVARIRARAAADRAAGLDQISDSTLVQNRSDQDRVHELMSRIEAIKNPPKTAQAPVAKPAWFSDLTAGQQRAIDSFGVWGATSRFDLRTARESIHDSAQAHFTDYEVAPGVRNVPLSSLGDLGGYDQSGEARRIGMLAEKIGESGEIEPIFVGVDENGDAYIMEGQHRARAFQQLGEESIPARVVLDMSDSRPKFSRKDLPTLRERLQQAHTELDAYMRDVRAGAEPDGDTYFSLADKATDAEKALTAEMADLPDDEFAFQGKTTDGRALVLNPSAQRAGYYQLTRFGTDGAPWGDTQFKTKTEAIREFLNDASVETIENFGGDLSAARYKQGRTTQSPGLQSAEIDKALAPTLAGWKNAPKVTTVQSVADLPFDAPDDARGAYLDGKVYLVADNLSSPQEARFVLLHESLGHGGLSGVLGGRLNLVMRTMYAQNEVLRNAADKTGIKDKAVAVEEVLADMAGADPQAIARLTGFDKLVANVRAWLRNHGFGVQWSDKDIINLLQQAGRHIENGRNGEPHVFGAESAKFSAGTTRKLDADLTEAAKRFFGVTRDPNEAGYVLPSGTMLDFSGRHYSSRDNWPYLKGQRAVDHREFFGESQLSSEKLPLENTNGSNAMAEFMNRTGAMRIDMYSGVASVMGYPSDAQITTLARARKGDYLALTAIDPATGRIIDEAEFDAATGAAIRRFFDATDGKEGKGPKFSRKSPQEVTDDSVSDSPEKWAYQTKQWAGKDKAAVVEVGSVSGAKLYHEGIAQPYGMGQITAVDPSGNVVGTAFYDRRDNDGKLEAAVEVSPSNRRKGIATAMYDAIESIRGEKLSPAENRTAYASAFWRKRSGNSGSFNPDTADIRFSRKSPGEGDNAPMPGSKALGPTSDARKSANQGNNTVVAKQISDAVADAMEEDPYADFGLRVIPPEYTGTVRDGDELEPSFRWEDGNWTDDSLPGVSAAEVKDASEASATAAIRNIGAFEKSRHYYHGSVVALVKGERTEYGEDPGEVVIKDATIVRTWRKPSTANVEILPNDLIAPDSAGVPKFSRKSLPDTINIDGQDRPTTNSNGKPIAQTEEGVRNFWAWFGDSKVVVDVQPVSRSAYASFQGLEPPTRVAEANPPAVNARPLVLYHGTNANVKAFDQSAGGRSTGHAGAALGTYLTSKPVLADYYADTAARDGKSGQNVVPVYVALQNPKRYESASAFYREADGFVGREADWRKALESEGFDGVIVRDDFEEVIAFDPAQIKSATGNSGAFNPDTADIRFSRKSPEETEAIRERAAAAIADRDLRNSAANNARDMLADLVRGNPKKGFGMLRGLNTQLYKATHNPEYKVVFDHAQAFQDDITVTALRAEELAPDILPRIQDVWRIGLKKYWNQRGLSKADNEAVGKFMAEGTLAGGPSPLDGKVWTDAELRAKGATDDQVKYYRQARAAIDKSLEDLALAEIAQVVRMGGTKVGFNPIGLNTSFKDTVDNLWAKFDAQVQAAHAAGDAELVQKLKDTRSLALEKFDHVEAMKAAGYAPLMRFGRHSVTLTDSNGQTLFFQMFETKTEALRTAQMLRDDPEYKGAVAKVGVVPTEAFKMFSGVSLDTLEAFGASAGSMQDPMVQDLLKLTVNNRSVMKRMIQRKGTEGYSLDATRGIARFITSNARRTSTLANGAGLRTAVAQIQDGQMQDEASRLAQYVMNPGEEMAKFRGFLFANFLGGSIAAGLVNMSQPVMMTMPWLSQYGGTRKAAATMAGSLKDTFASLRGHAIVDKDLEQALAKAENHGITNPQEIYQMMAAAENGTTSLMGAKFMRLWGANFALSEAANRRLTFVAAYKMARDMSPDERAEHKIEDPFDFAVETINQTQGIYAKQNRPNWARGAAGSVVFTFRQYSIAYCEFLRNLYGDGKLPKPAFNLAVGMLVLGAGTAGLPGSDDLDDLVDTIGAWMGYATNSKRWKQDFLSDLIGETAADIVQHGVSGIPGMPFDIAARLGLANLLPGTGLFNPTKADKSREITEVFGVAGGLAKNAIDSVNSLGQGDIGAVLKTNLPTAVRNLYQAAEMAATGEYRDRQGRKVVDVTLGDAVTKGVGFQPTTVSKDSGRASMVRGSVEIQKAKESEIVGGLVRAIHDKDPAARAEVMAKWQKWNADNPNYKVQIAPSQIASRLKAMQTTREQRLLKTTPAEIRRPIMDEIKRDKAA